MVINLQNYGEYESITRLQGNKAIVNSKIYSGLSKIGTMTDYYFKDYLLQSDIFTMNGNLCKNQKLFKNGEFIKNIFRILKKR